MTQTNGKIYHGIRLEESMLSKWPYHPRINAMLIILSMVFFFEDLGRKQRGTKQPLDESERGKWKSWLKTQHSKIKDHASSTITSWQIEKQWKQWQFIFSVSRSTEDGDGSHEIKRCLLLGRKATINLDSILKSRDITLPTKVHLVKAMVFPVVVYGCESWDTKENLVSRNWYFWTVVLEKTLESPLDCKEIKPVNPKGNQS